MARKILLHSTSHDSETSAVSQCFGFGLDPSSTTAISISQVHNSNRISCLSHPRLSWQPLMNSSKTWHFATNVSPLIKPRSLLASATTARVASDADRGYDDYERRKTGGGEKAGLDMVN